MLDRLWRPVFLERLVDAPLSLGRKLGARHPDLEGVFFVTGDRKRQYFAEQNHKGGRLFLRFLGQPFSAAIDRKRAEDNLP